MKFFATLLLLALVAAALAAYAVYTPVGPPANTPDSAATYVDIAPGTGTQAISAQLEEAGVVRSRFAFDLLRALKRGKLIAGEYRFNHPAPATEVYDRIVRGDVYTIPLTIPEGYNRSLQQPAARPRSSPISRPTRPRSRATSSPTPTALPAM